MNIKELEREIALTRERIKKTPSWKLKNDLGKYLKKLVKERDDYYIFRNERSVINNGELNNF